MWKDDRGERQIERNVKTEMGKKVWEKAKQREE